MEVVDVDGRRLRRKTNREAVLDAMVELFAAGSYQPSAAEIAERAGLSPRSLFRYFDDIDDLHRATIDRQLDAARPLLDVGVAPDAPTTEKIERLVAARTAMYETIAPAARAARVCAHRHPMIAAQVHESRSYLRHQVRRLFPTELDDATWPAVDALLAFEAFDLMRNDQGLSLTRTSAVLRSALNELLHAA